MSSRVVLFKSSSRLTGVTVVVATVLFLVSCGAAHSTDHEQEQGEWQPVSFTRDPVREQRKRELNIVGTCWQLEVTPCLRGCSEQRQNIGLKYNIAVMDETQQQQQQQQHDNDATTKTLKLNPTSSLASAVLNIIFEICTSYCQADTAWKCSQENHANGGIHTFKFGGRWPFQRWGIFAEPASAICSLLSVLLHIYGYIMYRRTRRELGTKYQQLLSQKEYQYEQQQQQQQQQPTPNDDTIASPPTSSKTTTTTTTTTPSTTTIDINRDNDNIDDWFNIDGLRIYHLVFWSLAYTFSLLFHTVDIRITEYLDYYGAVMVTSFAAYSSLVRALSIRIPGSAPASSIALLLATPFIAYVLFHCHHLYQSFDYKFHNIACITLMGTQVVVWMVWALVQLYYRCNTTAAWYMLSGQTFLILFASFEIWDFTPRFGVLDAHACYHLFANVVFVMMSRFEIADMHHSFKVVSSELDNKYK
jgi:hypothetical protein